MKTTGVMDTAIDFYPLLIAAGDAVIAASSHAAEIDCVALKRGGGTGLWRPVPIKEQKELCHRL
jgi:hypothetical protein